VDEQFLRIADAMQKAGSQGARLRNTMAIFDTEGVALVNTLSQGSEEIQKMIAEAERFGIIVSTESARAASEFQDNLGRLNAMASGFSITLGNQLIPAINEFVDNIINA